MIRNSLLILLISCLMCTQSQAQEKLSLQEAYALAEQQYPLYGQKALLKQTEEYTLQNAFVAYLPQLSVNGQATYQSDVTKIPVKLPGLNIESPPKDQYKLYAELNQTLYNGGMLGVQKDLIEANTAIEVQKQEVELYKLRERINQLYFGLLLLEEQLKQAETVRADITAMLKKAEAGVANGTVLQSSAYTLKAELLKTEQHMVEIRASQKAYKDMLGLFTGRNMDNTTLEKPAAISVADSVQRPELQLIDYQERLIDLQEKMIGVKNRPRLSFFVQGGYGRPALNMLATDFDTYYIGGLRFSWQLGGFYTAGKEKELLEINRSQFNIQKDNFLFNTLIALRQQSAEVGKYNELLRTDKEIIELRQKITGTARSQLENGAITASDYLRELHAEDTARQNLLLHEIQLLLAQYTQATTTGKE